MGSYSDQTHQRRKNLTGAASCSTTPRSPAVSRAASPPRASTPCIDPPGWPGPRRCDHHWARRSGGRRDRECQRPAADRGVDRAGSRRLHGTGGSRQGHPGTRRHGRQQPRTTREIRRRPKVMVVIGRSAAVSAKRRARLEAHAAAARGRWPSRRVRRADRVCNDRARARRRAPLPRPAGLTLAQDDVMPAVRVVA
jgi:hypothetical protein